MTSPMDVDPAFTPPGNKAVSNTSTSVIQTKSEANGLNDHRDARRVRPLSAAQERRLVDALEERFLEITRAFKKRTLPDTPLPTLASYLQTTRTLLSLILQIPPTGRSAPLRTTFLLRLTNDFMTSFAGYTPDFETLPKLLEWLDELDRGWIAVLRGQVWDTGMQEGADWEHDGDTEAGGERDMNGSSCSSKLSQTERTRLRSLLVTGTERMEEWLEGLQLAPRDEDLNAALERMGSQGDFDDLFVRTLGEMGGFGAEVNVPEGMIGTC